jgi:hypothetical protein
MEQTLLLKKNNRKQWIAMAGLFTFNGIVLMFGKDLVVVRFITGGAMIIMSISYLIYSFIGYSVKSKYAAKVRITDHLIELKTSFWKPLLTLRWADIQHIQFASYRVEFELRDGIKSIHYETSAEKSIELKQLLSASAAQHNIQVSGG